MEELYAEKFGFDEYDIIFPPCYNNYLIFGIVPTCTLYTSRISAVMCRNSNSRMLA